MHSFIVQITTNRINESEYYNDTEVIETEFVDYCQDISDCDREDAIDCIIKELCDTIPTILVRSGKDTIEYKGGINVFNAEFKKKVLDIVQGWDLSKNTFFSVDYSCSPIKLKNIVENPLETDLLFCVSGNTCTDYRPIKSYDFMEFLSTLNPNTTLYVGGIMDYHY